MDVWLIGYWLVGSFSCFGLFGCLVWSIGLKLSDFFGGKGDAEREGDTKKNRLITYF